MPPTGGRSRDLLCLHEGGVVAHAEADALHRTLLEAAHVAADDGALEDLSPTLTLTLTLTRHPYLLDDFLRAQPWWLDQHAVSVIQRAEGGPRPAP